MPGYEFLLGNAHHAFTPEGDLKEERTIDFLESCFWRFLRFTQVVNVLAEPEEVALTSGEFTVTTPGHNGEIPMVVRIDNNRIEAIDIDTSGESQGIADVVFTRIPKQIIEGQTLNVDIISGASVTSNGVIDGVAKVIKMAGSNPDILRKRPKAASALNTQDMEYHTDVVVVGAGCAGLTAAAKVLQEGKSVIVVEKFPAVGGNTVRTGGPMNAANPNWQNTFAAIPGERHALKEMIATDEATKNEEEYLFDSELFYRMQTYLGGKRKDKFGNVCKSCWNKFNCASRCLFLSACSLLIANAKITSAC